MLTNKTRLSRDTLSALPGLEYVGVLATGYDVVDVEAAGELGIVVTNVPRYGTPSVAQHVFALLLALANRVCEHAQAARAGRWSESGRFSYLEQPMRELSGLTLGLVGFGQIAQAVAHIALAMEMRVICATPRPIAGFSGVDQVPLDRLFELADVVSLHCPLKRETARLVDARRLASMKPTAFLINTARGGLVDESALCDALAAGSIAGAGLDVLSVEPPPRDHPLLSAPNCVVTPHNAWASRSSRARLLAGAVGNVEAFLRGAPTHVVAPR